MKISDAITGSVFALLGAFMMIYASGLAPPRHLQYGAGFFPSIIGAGLILVGGGIAWNGFRTLAAGRLVEIPHWVAERRGWLLFGAVIAATVFYLLAVDALGFLLTAAVLLFALFVVAGAPILRSLGIALATAIVFTVFFASLLHMPLPWGPLQGVSGWLIW
jgi:putative tricarboxylic transport membrane protein